MYISIMFMPRRPISCHEAQEPEQREIHVIVRYHKNMYPDGTYGVLNCSSAVDFRGGDGVAAWAPQQ